MPSTLCLDAVLDLKAAQPLKAALTAGAPQARGVCVRRLFAQP